MFVPLSPPPHSALGDFHGLVFIKRAGGCGGGRAVLFIASRGCAGIIRAAFVLPAGRPPARPGWSTASPAAAGRSRHVEREEKAAAPCPASPFHSPSQSAGGRGGREREKKKTNPKPPQIHHFPAAPGTRSAGRQGGDSPPRHRPALRRTRRRREGEAMMAAALTQHGARPGAPCPPPAAPPAARDTVLPQPFTK